MNWHDYFNYDNVSGLLTWKVRTQEMFQNPVYCDRWNKRYAGKVAGHIHSDGYRKVRVNDKLLRTYRIIYEMHEGSIPAGFDIDHMNGVRSDDRIENLRKATRSQNMMNMKPSTRSKSRLKGAAATGRGTWAAGIRIGGKQVRLGVFSTEIEAHAAYCEAAKKYHGEFARTQ